MESRDPKSDKMYFRYDTRVYFRDSVRLIMHQSFFDSRDNTSRNKLEESDVQFKRKKTPNFRHFGPKKPFFDSFLAKMKKKRL